MVKKKKVAVIVGRYYLTLPLIIGVYHLFDWDISVIDVGLDTTALAKDDFYMSLPSSIPTYQFAKERTLFRHLGKVKYDFVLATTVKHKGINKARMLGLISKLYVMFVAFLKPTSVLITSQHITGAERRSLKNRLGLVLHRLSKTGFYISLLKKLFAKLGNKQLEELNNPDAYDIIFCWNKAESHYYEGKRQVITAHPYHLYRASKVIAGEFRKKILIAHNGDPAYYTPGYNELVNQIIENYGNTCEVAVKAHPLSKELPTYNGKYEVIYKVIDEEKICQYDIFINEDSYMGVEMFFRGKQVINFGTINEETSNKDFTHLWSNDAEAIIHQIGFVIENWEEVNGKHIAFLKAYFAAYIPPIEFGPLALRAS
jgi:hypothetical protein